MPPERSQISQRPELVANSIPLPGADFFLGLKWRNQGNMNLKEKHFTLVYWKNSCVQQPQKDIAHGLNFFSVAKAHCLYLCIHLYIYEDTLRIRKIYRTFPQFASFWWNWVFVIFYGSFPWLHLKLPFHAFTSRIVTAKLLTLIRGVGDAHGEIGVGIVLRGKSSTNSSNGTIHGLKMSFVGTRWWTTTQHIME